MVNASLQGSDGACAFAGRTTAQELFAGGAEEERGTLMVLAMTGLTYGGAGAHS